MPPVRRVRRRTTPHRAARGTLPLLETKLSPPVSTTNLVARARLVPPAVLECRRKLTFVVAPAGYGKTILMTQLHATLAGLGRRTAWLSLDTGDSAIAQFLCYLVAAVRCTTTDFGRPALVLLDEGVSLTETAIARVLANELATLPDPITVFIDDVHELAHAPALALVRQLVHDTPPHIQFVISSRVRIDLGLGRLQAHDALTEIDWRELRFSDGETRAFFAHANGLEIDAATAAKVQARTEGWAAALRLAASSARDAPSLSALMDRSLGSEHGIAAYLAEDVLRHLRADLREFLLEIGALSRVCAELCDAVTGGHGAAQRLETLEAGNVFVHSLDGQPRWYRFHPLLSDFLRTQSERTQPGRLARVHARASAWFAATGAYDAAVEHALAAGEPATAATLLDAHAYDLWRDGHQARLDGWARRLPAALRRRHPRLRLVQAWSLMLSGRIDSAVRILDDVATQLDAGAFADRGVHGSASLGDDVLFMRLMLAFYQEETELAEALSERWLAHDRTGDPFLASAVKSVLAGSRGLMHELGYARRQAASIADLLEESGTSYGPIWSLSILGAMHLRAGYRDEAVGALDQAIGYAVRVGGRDTPLAAMPATLRALAAYETGDLDLAQRLAERHAGGTARLNFADHHIACLLLPVRLAAAGGDERGALAALERLARAALAQAHLPERVRAHVVHERLRLLAQLRRPQAVRGLVREERLDRSRETFTPIRAGGACRTVWAQARIRAALADEDARSALWLARKWTRYLHQREQPRPEVAFRLLAARANLALDDERAAQRELREAIRIAAPHGLVRLFLDEDGSVHPAIVRACRGLEIHGEEVAAFGDVLASALRRTDSMCDIVERTSVAARSASATRPLSPRELDVLSLVAQGMSNREAGACLGLTENTVKWNLRQVYQKLAVARRGQAVRRGRELGLIG